MSLADSIAKSIALFEGFYQSGSVAARNNNPGNLRNWGSTPVVDGFASFPTEAAGWDALRRQVELNISRGLSLNEFFGGKPGVYPGYAPAADANSPDTYAAFVGGQVGVSPDVPLSSGFFLPDLMPIIPAWDLAPVPEGENQLLLAAGMLAAGALLLV